MRSEGDRLPLVLATAVPVLAVKFGVGYLRFLGTRRRGVRAFERTLVQGGMPRGHAARLAEAYHGMGSLPQILRSVRIGR